MIDQNIILQILYFLVYGNKFIRVADGIPQKTDESVNSLHGTISVVLIDQPLDTGQSIIYVMWIDLHLQSFDL